MKVYVFVGPTLSIEEARAELDAVYLPPAAQGDVYRATLDAPAAIGIVDGYFERVPSIWHKEILWAMSHGVHVYGSASMGALRAAELEAFGMEGVGAIFEAFQSGELEDDDEVTVAHAPAEDGYRRVSEAMVNIRSTLARAEAEGILGPDARAAWVSLAKALHYTDRSYPALLSRGASQGRDTVEIEALRAFLRRGQVDQKRLDALAMLRVLRERLPGLAPKRVTYSFAHTDAWEQVRKEAGRQRVAAAPENSESPDDAVLEELKLSGAFRRAHAGALARALGLEEARRRGLVVTPEIMQAAVDAFRTAHRLHDAKAVRAWLAEQRLEGNDLVQLVQEEVLLGWVAAARSAEVAAHLPGYLRATGEYGALLDRAAGKARALAERGISSPTLTDAGLTEAELWRWYFEERLGQPVPASVTRYAQEAGFADANGLRQAALRERLSPR